MSFAGGQAVYLADQDTNDLDELYRVHLKSGVVTTLDEPMAGDVASFALDPKRRRVVYAGEDALGSHAELFRADLKSGAVTPLNAPLVPDGDVIGFLAGG